MVIVNDDVDRTRQIEGGNQEPEEGTYPYREKSKDRKQAGYEIAVRSEWRKPFRQIGANNARKNKYKAEKAKAVQRSDGALCFDRAQLLEPGKNVCTCTKQPRDIAQREMQEEDECRRHPVSFQIWRISASAFIDYNNNPIDSLFFTEAANKGTPTHHTVRNIRAIDRQEQSEVASPAPVSETTRRSEVTPTSMTLPSVTSRLLFLPGVLGNRDFWEPLARELRFQADKVFMAYPGFAGVPANPSITCFDDLVDAVVSQIECPTALIAQSMGGVLAIEATLRIPSQITHLVLIATSGGLDTSTFGAVDWRHSVKQDHPDLPNWFASYSSDLTAKLRSIDVPVLLIWGDCDPISPIAVGKTLLNQFPNAELHLISQGQHDLARVHARSVAAHIDAHLQKQSIIGSTRPNRG